MASEVHDMTAEHWDALYRGRSPDEFAWHEPVPATLSDVLEHSTPGDGVIDVGGGLSTLPIELVRQGYEDITVLDISEQAIAASRALLWQHTDVVSWIQADVVRFRPHRRWRLWHDRAVFHFLVHETDRAGYRAAAAAALAPGAMLVVATFAPDAPGQCAGLPVRRHDVGSLAAQFAPAFEFVDGHPLRPRCGGGDRRPYVVAVLRRAVDR